MTQLLEDENYFEQAAGGRAPELAESAPSDPRLLDAERASGPQPAVMLTDRKEPGDKFEKMMQPIRFVLFCELVFILSQISRLPATAEATEASEFKKFRRRTRPCCKSSSSRSSKWPTPRTHQESNHVQSTRTSCLVLLLLLLLAGGGGPAPIQPASAQDLALPQPNAAEGGALPLAAPEAQPLVYLPLSAEFGSGDSPARHQQQQQQSLAASSSSSSTDQPQQANDISSSLIEAKCWNNYQNDNDCKQLNFITQQQEGEGDPQRANNIGEEDDNIITPTVIFEASSTLPDDHDESGNSYGASGPPSWRLADPAPTTTTQRTQVFLAPPYYSSSTPAPAPPGTGWRHSSSGQDGQQQRTANDVYSAPPASATMLPPPRLGGGGDDDDEADRYAAPVTRPSVTDPRLFVATPRPQSPATARTTKAPKTTTLGRRCRDENDADCDEPDEAPSSSSGDAMGANAKGDGGDSDSDDDNENESDDGEDNELDSPVGRGPASEQLESGSGQGPPANPNDPDGESGPDDDANELEGSGAGAAGPAGGGHHHNHQQYATTVVTTESTTATPGVTTESGRFADDGGGGGGDSTVGSLFTQKPTAVINVFVHSDLPPNVPLATKRPQQDRENDEEPATQTTTTPSSPPPPTSTMADDTVTVKPIFPSTTMGPAAGGGGGQDSGAKFPSASSAAGDSNRTSETDRNNNDNDIIQQHQHQHQQQHTTPTPPARDPKLDQFMPVPLPKNERWRPAAASKSQPSLGPGPPAAGATMDGGSGAGSYPAFNPWSTKRPTTPAPLAGHGSDQFASPEESGGGGGGLAAAAAAANRPPAAQLQQSKGEKNSYLLLMSIIYGAVVVLILIVLVFGFVLFINWNRTKASRQAFLQAQKAQLLHNGAGGLPAHLVPSMSHASQLLLGQQLPAQQPGLLSTYAPGKGLAGGKVTTSLVKPPVGDESGPEELGGAGGGAGLGGSDERSNLINGKQSHDSNEDDDDDDDDDQGDDESDRFNDNGGAASAANMRRQMSSRQQQLQQGRMMPGDINNQQSASWSTEDQSTSGNSGASQRTQDSRLQDQLAAGGHPNFAVPQAVAGAGQQQVGRAHYPSSLSDGRQNSSSISDSQCSPDGAMGGPQQHPQQPHPMELELVNPLQPQQQQLHNQHPYQARGPPLQMGGSQQHQHQQQPPPHMAATNGFGGRPGAPMGPPAMMLQQQQLAQEFNGLLSKQSRFSDMESSCSFDSIRQQQQPSGSRVGLPDPAAMGPGRQAPPTQQQQQQLMNQFPMQRELSFAGPTPVSQTAPGAGNVRQQHQQQQQPNYQHHVMMMQQQQQQPSAISPQKIALNPMATLGRRGNPQATGGLNRNIYSEDSSSFMTTTSPSLARTSSSSSFAFNFNSPNNQLTGGAGVPRQPPPPVGPKPILDASGRIINDYSQPAGFLAANGRQDRGEPWFV